MKAGAMRQILIVEDDESIHAGLRALFLEEGYTVMDAFSGKQALDLLRGINLPLVVLLDWRLPDMDGGRVFATAHTEMPSDHGRAFIFCTANSDTLPLATVRLMAEMHVPLVRKPFDIDELLEVVADAADSLVA